MDPTGTLQFLQRQGASERLLQHAFLVQPAAGAVMAVMEQMGVALDHETVLVGSLLHDIGKTVHPEESHEAGAEHEAAGRELLLRSGYPPHIARICVSHGQWQAVDCSLEELAVALADKLWKGKREDALEATVIERVARSLGRQTWEVFQDLDACFETIAGDGHERLLQTQTTG